VFVDGELLRGVAGLRGDIFMVVEEALVLGVEFEAFVLEVVALFEDGFQLEGEGVVDELVFDDGFEVAQHLY
jgi:hypothetical protein